MRLYAWTSLVGVLRAKRIKNKMKGLEISSAMKHLPNLDALKKKILKQKCLYMFSKY